MTGNTKKLFEEIADITGKPVREVFKLWENTPRSERAALKQKMKHIAAQSEINKERVNKMVTSEQLKKAAPVLSVNGILTEAFAEARDVNRVRQKISRGTPLSVTESEAIGKVLNRHAVKLTNSN